MPVTGLSRYSDFAILGSRRREMDRRTNGLAIALFLGCFSGSSSLCYAQRTATATAQVTARIVAGTTVNASNGIVLGFSSGRGSASETVQGSPRIGSVTVIGQPKSNVSITMPGTVILRSISGRYLSFSTDVPVWNANSNGSGYPQPFPDNKGGTAQIGETGTLNIRFRAAVNTNQAADGSYRGEYTITIAY